MDWIFVALGWYWMLFILGIIFYPLTKKLFPIFFDQGYAFSKTVAILALSYASFVLGTLKIVPFTQISVFFILFLFLVLSGLLVRKYFFKNIGFSPPVFSIVVFQEILFLASFLFLVFVRGQEPAIRGLEKFMDFGFMNSILRSKYFPPLDMWLSADPTHPHGYPINYYYFGHLTGALLIKLNGVKPSIGYNLILATIFAQGMTLVFSLVFNLIYLFQTYVKKISKIAVLPITLFSLLGSFIVNLGGNLHTIYVFTSGYPNESPVPFWQILSTYNPAKYWYPNATRFIPFTIHEFPSYSYVVADLHGHVFDIPFVLLTLAILLVMFIKIKNEKPILNTKYLILNTAILGFMIAVHYMTNAFDGPIYLLLAVVFFFLQFGLTIRLLVSSLLTVGFFVLFSLPFSLNFNAFVSGIGVNCSPNFLVNLQKIGPFLFEKDKCQSSPFWMLFVLWGFFWLNLILFTIVKKHTKENKDSFLKLFDQYILIFFVIGIFLTIIPEFFYIKDIYPAHFRANTMFKLGYQAFMMMGIASAFTFYRISELKAKSKYVLQFFFIVFFFFILIYPLFSFPSYYGKLDKQPQPDGGAWMKSEFPPDKEIIDFLNTHLKDQPVILEAQGDSYTDYERISAYTGLPTVAGWWVHEWLWRGSPEVVGKRIPDIENIYESKDIKLTKSLIEKYHISFVIVSSFEKEKYKNLYEDKFSVLGRKIFESSNGFGAVYQLNLEGS